MTELDRVSDNQKHRSLGFDGLPMTYVLKSSNLGLLLIVGQTILHVVDRHTAGSVFEASVTSLWNSMEAAISSLIEENGGPII